ncbi:MAG: TonB-dependent receptor [Candidatus Cryptobacteroides sp.]|nr:TonB-dependent receptor [Candidatus Cryptobacteroides sp.]
MRRYFYLVLTLLPLMLSALAFGQSKGIKVTGKVIDDQGLPLPGITVYQDGNVSAGTITNAEGVYSLTVPSNAVLIYSALGFVEVKENVAGRSVINVTLHDEKLELDAAEVVSVGYGSVTRRDLTGSVSKVDMDELMKTPVTNFDQAIQGRVAGVVVTTSDGAVGSSANIVIRGNNSLTQSSAPLYVIDGFPTESSMATSLNPADIQSMDILKDASATAIYGARGANGVIVITTKQGTEGKPVINFNSYWTANNLANKVELMDAYEFVCLQDEYYASRKVANIYLDGFDEAGEKVHNFYSLEDYKNTPFADWQDRIYRTALTQNYNISLSGGSKNAGNRYNVGLSATDMDGIIVNSNFSRYQGKINFIQKIGKIITAELNANYSRSITSGTNPTSAQQSSSASGWLMYSVWGYRPVKPLSAGVIDDDWFDQLVDEEISGSNDYRFNPAKSVRNEYRKTLVDNFSANLAVNFDFTDALRLRITGGYNAYNSRNEQFNGTETYTGYPASSSGLGVNGAIYWTDRTSWVNENTLTWNKTIRRHHHLNILAGITFQGENRSYRGVKAIRMTNETLGLNGLHTGTYQPVTPWQRDWTMMSYLARLNYNYKYKYYLTASFRADGSSKFPKANRWGFFPSASFAWNFNREDIMKQFDWLSNGKIRMSWGQTGNNRTDTPYDFYAQITTLPGSTESLDYVFDGSYVPGYFPSNMANDLLKWETTAQTDIGLDLGFFENRIKMTADYYSKSTYDLLLMATLPASSGYTSAMVNIGSMRNRGFEFSLDLIPVKTRDFEWAFNMNIAFNRNKVMALTNNQYSLLSPVKWDTRFNAQYPYITQVGKPSGMMYGYIYEGTYKADDFAGNSLKDGVPYMSSVGRSSTRPGDPKYRDVNDDGVIDDNDRTIIGCGQPLHTGGFGSNFNYRNFDLSFFFNWSYGNDVLNANRLIFENASVGDLNQFKSMTNRFNEQTNPNSDIPRMLAQGMFVYSSRVVEDASFLRLKNISLGYTFPKSTLQRIRCSKLRVYVSAENLWTLTGYSGPDPEVSTRNSVLTPGFDWSAYPRAWGVTGGLSMTF